MGQANAIRSPRLHALLSKGKALRFNKNEAVTNTEDMESIFLVLSGYAKRYSITNGGTLGVQTIYGAQDLFSLTKVFGVLLGQSLYDGPETYYYSTMSEAQILALDIPTFVASVQQNRSLYEELFSEAGRHLKVCIYNIESASLGPAYRRVAHQLLFFAKEFGSPTPQGIEINIPLTHQDIADILGLARETVSVAMAKLRSSGLLHRDKGCFVIKSIDALTAEAYA